MECTKLLSIKPIKQQKYDMLEYVNWLLLKILSKWHHLSFILQSHYNYTVQGLILSPNQFETKEILQTEMHMC